jgi:glycosyltransferase involved in cell wall biosynthesis
LNAFPPWTGFPEPAAQLAESATEVVMLLSVLIPVYNERKTLAALLEIVCGALPGVDKELIVVDDCSTDGTRDWLRGNFPDGARSATSVAVDPGGNLALAQAQSGATVTIRPLYHAHNKGKGGALQTALAAATGDVVIIQDADLEYDPQDWTLMLDLIVQRKVADVVYGSRFHGRPHRSLHYHHYLANRLISTVFSLLYNQALSDVEVCYKMFTRQVKDSLRITCNDFGFELQLGAQIVRARRWRIYEVGIQYYGRSYDEGKKINWKDGVKALWYLLKFRFAR